MYEMKPEYYIHMYIHFVLLSFSNSFDASINKISLDVRFFFYTITIVGMLVS